MARKFAAKSGARDGWWAACGYRRVTVRPRRTVLRAVRNLGHAL